ncbi:hypothetical protein BDY17DRAFT_201991 [Neohortaea acidophila]|uniref:2EXR domain-containing protein n=1 Tax=Neohortaea acidophila TaxID=245834 RepID=A0A6A6PLD0_9PEZI|nr:uncharacterized protein BDY17DRAFT_201991 [Neohortaea acidophila]KAF2480888.1 hypothetical protein BDY17DRAFT_201991 [Neohortaea acidophila]
MMDNSPFARLSPELRNMIWKLAVTQNRPISLDCYENPEPPITRVCEQIRQESIGLFYGGNIFLESLGNAQYFANEELRASYEAIGPERYGLIRQFEIWTDNVSETQITERYVIKTETEEVLDGRRLFGVPVSKECFRGPQVIRITAHHSMPKAFTSEWVRGSDNYYRRVEDSQSIWVQERIKAIQEGIKKDRDEEDIEDSIGYASSVDYVGSYCDNGGFDSDDESALALA